MGDADKSKINVDMLCEMWEQMQHRFEMDIRVLLDKSKWLAVQLTKVVDTPPEPIKRLRSQQKLKLNHLMIHLTEELQRQRDKASAKRRLQEWNKSLDKMRFKIRVLSESLSKVGIDVLAMQNLCETQDNSQQNFEQLSQALQQCEALRAQNLSVLIDQVRTEINQWCDLTLQYPTVGNYQKDCCNEELLVLLEDQLADIKEYYNSNRSIFELFAKRVKLWTRMAALEDKAKEPNRYHNRGGALLREERERKLISIKLPQIEQQLNELVQAFVERTKQPFLVQGEEILGRIATDWDDYRLAKEQETIARKKAATDSVLEPPSSTHSSVISLRKTTSVPYFNSTTVSTVSPWAVKQQPDKQRERSK